MKKILYLILIMLFSCLTAGAEGGFSVEEVKYNQDKSITVYADCGSFDNEFGIAVESPSYDVKLYKAYSKNSSGKYGVVIPYSEYAEKGEIVVKAYGKSDNGIVYSEKGISVNGESYFSRVPVLSGAVPSEGTLYPAFSSGVTEYYVLVDSIPAKPLNVEFTAENKNDTVLYLGAEDVGDSVKIKLSSGFEENSYTFKYRLRKTAVLSPDMFVVKSGSNIPYETDGIRISSGETTYVGFDAGKLPEKYVPVSANCIVSGSSNKKISLAKCTEPFFREKDFSNILASYKPQTETGISEVLKSTETKITLDENQFGTVRDFIVAISGDTGATVDKITFELEYFEDYPLPVTDVTIASSLLSALSVDGANEIWPAFSKDVFEYYAVFNKLPANLPKTVCTAENPKAEINIAAAGNLSGETVITVSFEGEKSVYTIKYREYKETSMELAALRAKRTPYELYNIAFPKSTGTPYASSVGTMENEYGTAYSHLTAMSFDDSSITDENIAISSAELVFFATTNCSEGMHVDIYRSGNTAWPYDTSAQTFYSVANHLAPKGAEGKLNKDTLIRYSRSSYLLYTKYRYYTVPLKTEGFTDPDSINLYFMPRWSYNSTYSSDYQQIYLWLGINGVKTYSGVGILPTVYVKYFTK